MGIEKRSVNIKEYPSTLQSPSDEMTLGDLHGNALRLLHFLVSRGIVQISQEDYERFVNIYYEQSNAKIWEECERIEQEATDRIKGFTALFHYLEKQANHFNFSNIMQFFSILDNITVIDHSRLIRLIGDELADRGSSDLYTLLLLNKLCKGETRVPLEILFSNHGAHAIYYYENILMNPAQFGTIGHTALLALIGPNVAQRYIHEGLKGNEITTQEKKKSENPVSTYYKFMHETYSLARFHAFLQGLNDPQNFKAKVYQYLIERFQSSADNTEDVTKHIDEAENYFFTLQNIDTKTRIVEIESVYPNLVKDIKDYLLTSKGWKASLLTLLPEFQNTQFNSDNELPEEVLRKITNLATKFGSLSTYPHGEIFNLLYKINQVNFNTFADLKTSHEDLYRKVGRSLSEKNIAEDNKGTIIKKLISESSILSELSKTFPNIGHDLFRSPVFKQQRSTAEPAIDPTATVQNYLKTADKDAVLNFLIRNLTGNEALPLLAQYFYNKREEHAKTVLGSVNSESLHQLYEEFGLKTTEPFDAETFIRELFQKLNSLYRIHIGVDTATTVNDATIKLFEDTYKPSLKLLSYSLSQDRKAITVYSHAAINLKAIKNVVKRFNALLKAKIEQPNTNEAELAQLKEAAQRKHNYNSATGLAATIDWINDFAHKHCIDKNTFFSEYANSDPNKSVFFLANNRDTEILKGKSFPSKVFYTVGRFFNFLKKLNPFRSHKKPIQFIHGHNDKTLSEGETRITLDNHLGQYSTEFEGEEVIFARNNTVAFPTRPTVERQESEIPTASESTTSHSAPGTPSSETEKQQIHYIEKNDAEGQSTSHALISAKLDRDTQHRLVQTAIETAVNNQKQKGYSSITVTTRFTDQGLFKTAEECAHRLGVAIVNKLPQDKRQESPQSEQSVSQPVI